MPEVLFTRNLSLFRENGLADLAGPLENLTENSAELIGRPETADCNIKLSNGRHFYEGDARSPAAQQMQHFISNPVRYYADQPRAGGASNGLHHDSLIQDLLQDFQGQEICSEPEPSAGFFICFGLGLGLQIPLALAAFPFRNLIIVEPELELIRHCLHVLNWQEIFEEIQQRGGEIRFLTEADPTAASRELLHMMRNRDYPLADGSYIFQHYPSAYFEQLIPAFRDNLVNLPASMGFFEDECLMMKNAWANFQAYDFRQLRPQTQSPKPLPAFIVGSGPSFDRALPTLKRDREKAVYFSVGTGISTLIENGITPDFHCEVENTDLTVEALEKASPAGYPDTILIAATTVPPETAALFKSVIFCHRDSVVPSRLLVHSEDTVPFAVPTVANLACRAAMSFGLPELIFFGVDFGSPEPDHHHSNSSVYETEGSEFFKTGAGMATLSIPADGNRGDVVYTNRSFFNAKIYLEKLLASSSGFKVFNAGDGLKIEGAAAVEAEAIQLRMPPIPRPEVIQLILAEMPMTQKGQLCNQDLLESFKISITQWHSRIDKVVRDHTARDLMDFHLKIRPLLQQGQGDTSHTIDAATRALASGSIMMMIQTAWFFMRRMDDANRQRFWDRFQEQFLIHLEKMRDEAIEGMK